MLRVRARILLVSPANRLRVTDDVRMCTNLLEQRLGKYIYMLLLLPLYDSKTIPLQQYHAITSTRTSGWSGEQSDRLLSVLSSLST